MEVDPLVALMRFTHTHLPVKERAKLILTVQQQREQPLPPDFVQKMALAMHLLDNRVRYQAQHFPSWDELPTELREAIEARKIASGSNVSSLNTLLALQRAEKEAFEKLAETAPQVTEEEVDSLVKAYLVRYPKGEK